MSDERLLSLSKVEVDIGEECRCLSNCHSKWSSGRCHRSKTVVRSEDNFAGSIGQPETPTGVNRALLGVR